MCCMKSSSSPRSGEQTGLGVDVATTFSFPFFVPSVFLLYCPTPSSSPYPLLVSPCAHNSNCILSHLLVARFLAVSVLSSFTHRP